jgi:HEAT repeat protein
MRSGRGFFQIGAATAAVASALIFAAPRVAFAQSDVSKTAEEEAAHAADYERDYAMALRLYDAALSAARAKDASGEGPDVARLTAARARVAALAGDEASRGEGAQDDAASRPAPSFERRAHEVVRWAARHHPSPEPPYRLEESVRRRAALLGGELAPYLRSMLHGAPVDGDPGESPSTVQPVVAAMVLAAIDDPKADAVLTEATTSTDPIVAQAAVRVLHPVRQRHLISAAWQSRSAEIRSAAMDAMSAAESEDDFAASFLLSGAREGSRSACRWLVRNRRANASSVLSEETLPKDARRALLDAFAESELPPTRADVETMLRLSVALGPEAEWDFANYVASVIRRGLGRDAIRESRAAIESWVLAALGKTASPSAFYMREIWPVVAGQASIAALERLYNAGSIHDQGVSVQPHVAFYEVHRAVQSAYDDDFPALAAALRWTDPSFFAPSNRNEPRKDAVRSAVASMLLTVCARTASDGVLAAVKASEGAARNFLIQEVVPAHLRSSLVPKSADAASLEDLAVILLREARTDGDADLALSRLRDDAPGRRDAIVLEVLAFFERNEFPSMGSSRVVDVLRSREKSQVASIVEPRLKNLGPEPESDRYLDLAFVLDAPAQLRVVDALRSREAGARRRTGLHRILLHGVRGEEGLKRAIDPSYVGPITDSESFVRAITLISGSLYRPGIPFLREALVHENADVRKKAQEAFEVFKANRAAIEEIDAWLRSDVQKGDATAELTKLLESEKREVVIGAVKALGALKAKTALHRLVKLLERDDAELRAAVDAAIAKIGE